MGIFLYQSDSSRVGTDGDGTSDIIERNVIGGSSTGISLSQNTGPSVIAGN